MPLDYLLVGAVVFAVNLLPAFGPPTWAVLIFLRLNYDLSAVPLVVVGAVAAASGRFVLATGSRHSRRFLSPKRLTSIEAARDALSGSRRRTFVGLALFLISPVPSAQLFVAAGLMTIPLAPLIAAFFAGRLVSYSIYVAGASAAKHTFGTVITDSLTSPVGIAAQLVMLAALVALVRLDWAAILTHRRTVPRADVAPGPKDG
jgi:uncharacterized membrane protein YdjX (TVP38/TMEM64 family)